MKRLGLIVAIALFSIEGFSTHLLGVKLGYRHLSGDSFEITADFFRYCGGTAFNSGNCTSAATVPNALTITAYCFNNGQSTNFNLAQDTIMDITQLCDSLDSIVNSCKVGTCGLLGMQRSFYRDTIELTGISNGCNHWRLFCATGARAPNTNLVGYTGVLGYADLNITSVIINNSVVFNPPNPIPIYCTGKVNTYNWNAYDPDGDSLWWELDTSYAQFSFGNLTPNAYLSGYSPTSPMPGIVTIDHQTGEIGFTASIPTGYNFAGYAVAVRVDEYGAQSGVYKGSVYRDVLFYVLDSCDNLAPVSNETTMGGMGTFESNTLKLCPGDSFVLELIFSDLDSLGNYTTTIPTVFSNIDQILPNTTWTTSNTNPDTFRITSTNVPANIFTNTFTITVDDGNCPFPSISTFNYKLEIAQKPELGNDFKLCDKDSAQLFALHSGKKFSWSVLQGDPIIVGTNFGCDSCYNPWIHPSQTTTYVVRNEQNAACLFKDTVTVSVFSTYPIDLTPMYGGTPATTVYCASDSQDTILTQTAGGVYFGSGITDTILGVFSPSLLDPGVGNDSAINVVYIIDSACYSVDTLHIRVKGKPLAQIISSDSFPDSLTSTQLLNISQAGTQTWSNVNKSGNPTANGIFYPSLFIAPTSVYIFLNVNDSGCVNSDSTWIYIYKDTTSIPEPEGIRELSALISIFPNPSQGKIEINSSVQMSQIQVLDIRGVSIKLVRPLSNQYQFDLSKFSQGMYFIEIESNGALIYKEKLLLER